MSNLNCGDAIEPDAFLQDGSAAARRISYCMAAVLIVAIAADCLLTSPPGFSERHLQDTSLLRPIVTALALGGKFPTARGVEIRDLIYGVGAAALVMLAGARLMIARRRPRFSTDDLWDFRRRASTPYFWWALLLIVSVTSSYYAHAPDVCRGQVVLRFVHFAWWLPLAAMLQPRHVDALARVLVGVLTITAAIGIWHYLARVRPEFPDRRLQYPIGNELWMAACLLPGLMLAIAGPWRGTFGITGRAVATIVLVAAIAMTQSRSALAGAAVGVWTGILLAAGGKRRRAILLVIALIGLGAAGYLQYLRMAGVMGQRAHSVRMRLNYEWPYAIRLFMLKPVAGHGDGAYALLAGAMARDDQLDDPGTLRFDEQHWTAHAHNEFLELLADLGIVGGAAFAAAIGICILRAVKYCDQYRADAARVPQRQLVIAMMMATAALVIDQCGETALREPGLPPIFFGVWAMLWAMVRPERIAVTTGADTPRFTLRGIRGVAMILVAGGVGIGYAGVQNWRGARARQKAALAMEAGAFKEAVHHADFAAETILDPFQHCLARMLSVWARSLAFDRALAAGSTQPTDEEIEDAKDGLFFLAKLHKAAPRFLRVSRLDADLSLNLARVSERRGNRAAEARYEAHFKHALEQSRADDPFLVDRVTALWFAKPEALPAERLYWLRCLIRNGEIPEEAVELFRSLGELPRFGGVLQDLYALAMQDVEAPPQRWRDRLTPESFRLSALAKALAGDLRQAEELAKKAVGLYERVGPRLFAAHAAAIHEMVKYRAAQDPTERVDENLAALADAESLSAAPVDARAPLRGPMAETRLLILVAAGRLEDAKAQIVEQERHLHRRTAEEPFIRARLAAAFTEAARASLGNPRLREKAKAYAQEAIELETKLAEPHAILARAALEEGDEERAFEEAVRFIEQAEQRERAIRYLSRVRLRFPNSPAWAKLQTRYPDPAWVENPQPTTRPS